MSATITQSREALLREFLGLLRSDGVDSDRVRKFKANFASDPEALKRAVIAEKLFRHKDVILSELRQPTPVPALPPLQQRRPGLMRT